ncbi:MAG: manganese efflux pump MntP family protein [Eubacteriales bacterium]|nr:manganese efflux pump MntP family protein [Eubacteriales bacterium]
MSSFFELLLLALSLSVDAMVAATTIGLCKADLSVKDGILVGTYFGGFQALMPLLGYLLGSQLRKIVQPYDHWIILALLLFVGGKMILDGREMEDEEVVCNPCSHSRLLLLAIATSIDAMAAGISLSLSEAPMLSSVLVIGIVTFILSFVGTMWGQSLGSRFRSTASMIGGLVLISIGIKVVIEHMVQAI